MYWINNVAIASKKNLFPERQKSQKILAEFALPQALKVKETKQNVKRHQGCHRFARRTSLKNYCPSTKTHQLMYTLWE